MILDRELSSQKSQQDLQQRNDAIMPTLEKGLSDCTGGWVEVLWGMRRPEEGKAGRRGGSYILVAVGKWRRDTDGETGKSTAIRGPWP